MTTLIEGGLYAQRTGMLRWSVFKILRLDREVAHLRLYGNRFWRKPTPQVTGALDWSVGHLPMARDTVESWTLHLLAEQSVTPDELQGYDIWKDDPDAGAFS